MKKYSSLVLLAFVLAGIVLPSAFAHAAATSTPKVAHLKHAISHQAITHGTFTKPSFALHASGVLTGTTANSITISVSPDFENSATTTKTYTTDSTTKFSKDGSEVTIDKLVKGDLMEVMLRPSGSNAVIVHSVTDTGLGGASADIKNNAKLNAIRGAVFLKKK